jgi:hypothetical protein
MEMKIESTGHFFGLVLIVMGLIIQGCTTVTVDQVTHQKASLSQGDAIVVIGRRSGSDYETEPELVACIGEVLARSNSELIIIPEADFVDRLYPWFEARTAPTQVRDLSRLLSYKKISTLIDEYQVQYIVWVDGNTEKTSSAGSISCGLSATGAACFGFGTWDTKSEYEATIWNYNTRQLTGKISSSADGTSYMPAVVVPIPIIAPVQSDACKAMAFQLGQFFGSESARN